MKKIMCPFFIIVLIHTGFAGMSLAQEEISADETVQKNDIQQNVNDMLKLLEDLQKDGWMNESLLIPKEETGPTDPLERFVSPETPKDPAETNTPEHRIEKANEVVRLDPDDPQSHFQLGLEYWASKNLGEAIHQFEEVVRLDQENAHAHWNLGLLYAESDKGPEAIANIKKAEAIYTKYHYSTYAGQARDRLKRYNEKFGDSAGNPPATR